MIRLTETERAQLLARPDLTKRQRQVATLRYRDGLPGHVIAARCGLTLHSVTSILCAARKLLAREPVDRKGGRSSTKVPPLSAALDDPGWWTRNADMVRKLAHDPDHQERYLHCLEMLFGAEVSEQIRKRADA